MQIGVIIFNINIKKYLFLHYPGELKTRDYWGFPKGSKYKGEEDLETAKRIIWEETGISNILFDLSFKEIKDQIIYFYGTTKQEEVLISDEYIGYRWLTPGESKKIEEDLIKKVESK